MDRPANNKNKSRKHPNDSRIKHWMCLFSLKTRDGFWETIVFLITLCLPLCLQVFFHPGAASDCRIVVIFLQIVAILVGIICLSPLCPKIPSKIKILILLWLGWGCVCAMNSQYYMVSSLRQIEWVVLILFIGMLIATFRQKTSIIFWAYGMLLTGFIFVCTVIVVYWNSIPEPRSYDWVWKMPQFTNIRNFGHYAAAATIMASIGAVWLTHQWAEIRLRCMQIMLIAIQTVAFGFLFWSGGRGSVMAVLSGLLWLFIFGVNKYKRWLFVLLTTFSAGVGFVLSSLFAVQNRSLGFFNMFDRTLERSTLDQMLSGRLTLWEMALKLITPPEGSLLFGYGPDAYKMYPDTLHHIVQPHNVIIQSLLEWGVPGTILFCIILIYIYNLCWTQAKEMKSIQFELMHLAMFGAQALLIGYLFLGLVDGVFYHALPLTILSVSVAIIFAYTSLSKQDL